MFPSIRAVNDHPCISRLVRLGVRCDHGRAILLFGDSLSSTDSATAVAALFARVAGTMKSSDFPSAYMSAVPPEAFADRSNSKELETVGISRFSRLKFPDMLRFYDSAVPPHHLPYRDAACCLPIRPTASAHEKGDFGAQWLACLYLLPMLHPRCYHRQRTAQGRSDWLGLLRKTLSFSTPSRFIPALSGFERPKIRDDCRNLRAPPREWDIDTAHRMETGERLQAVVFQQLSHLLIR